MSVNEYKEAIKNLIDSTNNHSLLKHWKQQLEWDIQNQETVELSDEEWNLVQEGIEDIKQGQIISMNDFIGKRQ